MLGWHARLQKDSDCHCQSEGRRKAFKVTLHPDLKMLSSLTVMLYRSQITLGFFCGAHRGKYCKMYCSLFMLMKTLAFSMLMTSILIINFFYYFFVL